MDGIKYAVFTEKSLRLLGKNQYTFNVEIIIRQVTSKVRVSEDGMSNVFLPGELIGLLRAERGVFRIIQAIFSLFWLLLSTFLREMVKDLRR